jgi:photosystem II stability/assembly factor-like uncharacterized protein
MKHITAFLISLILLIPVAGKAQWIEMNGPSNVDITSLTMIGNRLLAGTILGDVFRSDDNGMSWTEASSGLNISSGQHPISSFAISGSNIFATSYLRGVFRSSDRGVNWTEVNSGLLSFGVGPLAVSGTNIFVGWVSANGDNYLSNIYRSTDSGTSWVVTSKGLTLNEDPISCIAVLDTDIFASLNSIYRSPNQGATWDSLKLGEGQCFAVIDTTLFFAGINDSGISRSTDRGAHWIAAGHGLPGTIVEMAVLDTILFAATRDSVFVSTDYGDQWSAEDSGLTSDPILSMAASKDYLFVGTAHTGVWRLSISNITGLASVQQPAQATEIQIQVTQSGDHLFANTEEAPAEIRIMNILGAEVLSQNCTGELDVDLSPLPAGVYFAQVQSGDALEVKKIVVMH